MEFNINSVVKKAKDVFDIAAQTTEKAVNVQKKKYNIVSIKNKLSDEYKKLGELYYASLNGKDNSVELETAVSLVKMRLEELEAAKLALAEEKDKKLCPKCSKEVEANSTFCNFCGAQLSEE